MRKVSIQSFPQSQRSRISLETLQQQEAKALMEVRLLAVHLEINSIRSRSRDTATCRLCMDTLRAASFLVEEDIQELLLQA